MKSTAPAVCRRMVFAGLAATALCSCSTPRLQPEPALQPVRNVDFRTTPELKDLAERARQVGNTRYPKVCALLADGNPKFPRRFDIAFTRRLPNGNTADASFGRIRLSAQYADSFRENPSQFDQVVTHEMAHVAQRYWRPILGHWIGYSHDPPVHWVEGIADYVSFKLGETNGSRCAQCDFLYPDYRSGYSCAGAFLLYLDRTYNSNIVRQLNARLRDGGFSDAFFTEATGKPLPALWAEFQQTAAFTPNAARVLELQRTLGYKNGKPPKDVVQRLNALVDERADVSTKELLQSAQIWGMTRKNIQARMALFLYFTQPGGTAEAFLVQLKKDGKVPGFAEGEKGSLSGFLRPNDLSPTFPVSRAFIATKLGDPSKYHYVLARDSAQSEWHLQRAWRCHADGQVAEEFSVR